MSVVPGMMGPFICSRRVRIGLDIVGKVEAGDQFFYILRGEVYYTPSAIYLLVNV